MDVDGGINLMSYYTYYQLAIFCSGLLYFLLCFDMLIKITKRLFSVSALVCPPVTEHLAFSIQIMFDLHVLRTRIE